MMNEWEREELDGDDRVGGLGEATDGGPYMGVIDIQWY